MARSYRHIQQYEKEILKLMEQGLTHKEIGEQLGFTQKQVKKFIERYHRSEERDIANTARLCTDMIICSIVIFMLTGLIRSG